jgi:hypothetical protein
MAKTFTIKTVILKTILKEIPGLCQKAKTDPFLVPKQLARKGRKVDV